MARLYANENFPFPVVEELRRRSHDAITIAETGKANQKGSDEQVLEFAISDERAVLTFNRKHFFRLHRQRPKHRGIVSCTYAAPRSPRQRPRSAMVARHVQGDRGLDVRQSAFTSGSLPVLVDASCGGRRAKMTYRQGIRNSATRTSMLRPPMAPTAIGWSMSPPSSQFSARGRKPTTVVIVVMTRGRKRTLAAFTTASTGDNLRCRQKVVPKTASQHGTSCYVSQIRNPRQ